MIENRSPEFITSLESSPQNGLVGEYDKDGNLLASGPYKDGRRTGVWWFYQQDGGTLVGRVDEVGALTGNNIAYIYPDHWTALVGDFKEGAMQRAKLARVTNCINGVPEFHIFPSDVEYKEDISTRSHFCSEPLLPDPFEDQRVFVKKSDIEGANEGVFARFDVGIGAIMSFYNGIRLTDNEVDQRGWSENTYTMILDEEIILDVPAPYTGIDQYCATLGHKVNHSFTPNCVCDFFEHPRFGPIMAMQTIKAVKKNEELTINYGYGPMVIGEEFDVPPWYREIMPYVEATTNT